MYVFILVVGVLIGITIGIEIYRHANYGCIKVYKTDEDGPYLFLELNKEVPELCKKQYVTFKVQIGDCHSVTGMHEIPPQFNPPK